MNRRGVVFTLIALVLAAFLLSAQYPGEGALSTAAAETLAAQSRVTALNAYLSTFESHAADSLGTSGYFALRSISVNVGHEGRFVADLNGTLRRCVIDNNLTRRGAGAARLPCVEGRHSLNASLHNLTALAASTLGIVTRYEVHDVWVTEERPGEVVLWMNISYNVTDGISEPFARWDIHGRILRADVGVWGIEDPAYMYLNGTGHTLEQRAFSLTGLKPHEFNPGTFAAFYGSRSYVIMEGRAPSVLQRYRGDMTAASACCGIESVMLRAQLVGGDANATYQNLSMVDHHFAANKQGSRGLFACDRTVRAIRVGGRKLVIESDRFDNRYNLSGSPDAVSACGWP